MKRALLLKILYYIFFAVLVLIALGMFMEIIDFPYYNENLSSFLRSVIKQLDL